MQRFAVEIKSAVWNKLKNIFNKYAEGKDYISVSRLEAMVKQVLHEETPTQVDYVIKNTNRIDKDNNGTIEFQQFGNFLLKRHCGEMALQKMHRCNKIANGHIRKITISEFGELLNSAYQFLGVQVDQKVVTQIFYNIDKDKDNLITYAQYFGFTDAYLLDTKPLAQKKKQLQKTQIFQKRIDQPAKQFQSRLRKFLMSQIKRLFEAYDKDVNKLLDENEMRLLLLQVFGLDSNQINRVLNHHFKPDVQGKYQSYDAFVINFLNYVSELGWLNINRQLLPQGRTSISQGQFFKLIDEAFKHLNIGRVNKGLFLSYFKLLDKNHDGLIDIADFKIWVSKFLSPQRYYGSQYYIQQDDENLGYGKGMISEPSVRIQRVQFSPARSIDSARKSLKLSQIKFDSRITVKQKTARPNKLTDSQISVISNRSGRQIVSRFNFSSLDLAKRVRRQMMTILTRLDKNHNRQFQQPQIIEALQILMKADKRQVLYVIANVFRYDRNNDHIVTYEELANFFLQIHFGQIAIQRLHKQDSYIKGAERIMNMSQFVRTLDYALSFIQIETYEGQAQTLFKQIDLNKDGWISYQEYFEFLIHYFGTQSVAAQVQRRNRRKTLSQITTNKGQQVPPEERLSRLIRTQIKVLFIQYDKNKNVKFEREQALQIAKQILNQTEQQARSMVNIVFQKNPQFVQYDELINKFLELHSSETILLRLHKQGILKNNKDRTIDIHDFMTLINSAFIRVPVLPSKSQYAQIFKRIDSSSDRISYRQYQHFVSRYLGKCDDRSFNTVFEQPSRLTQFVKKSISTNGNIGNISNSLYSKLKSVYQKYDRNNQGLQKQTFSSYLKQICNQTKRQNLQYIIWAIYRVDQDQDNKINLIQSAPYMLLLLAQLALQDFHHSRPLLTNKQRLSSQDFFSVLQLTYPFCESLKRESLSSIFQQIDTDNDGYVSDIEYLTWINSMSKSCVNPA